MPWPKGTNGPGHGGPASGVPASGIPAGGLGTGPPKPYAASDGAPVVHGVYSERVRNDVSDALLAELREEFGAEWINGLDHAALLAFVNSEAVCRQLRTHLLRVGHAQAPGLSDLLRRWEGRAAAARDALGLSPASRCRLARDVGTGAAGAAAAAALVQMAANGRKALLDRGWIEGGEGDGSGR